MSANHVPIHPDSPLSGITTVSTANAETIYSVGAVSTVVQPTSKNGGIVQRLRIKALDTTTAGMIRLWLGSPTGPSWLLWKEIPVTAITPSATVESFEADVITGLTDPLLLPYNSGSSECLALGASTENAEPFGIFAEGGEY